MTIQETIAFLVETKLCCKHSGNKQLSDICDISIKALEKQIPQQLNYESDGYADDGELIFDTAICRSCGYDFEYGINDWGSNYCPDCGQALDWGD